MELVHWSSDRAYATGGADVAAGELVEIAGSGFALVTALLADRVELAPFTDRVPPYGAAVARVGPLAIPSGDELIGRRVDPSATPLDGGPPIARVDLQPLFARDRAVGVVRGDRLTLGLLALDLKRMFGRGTSFAVDGSRALLDHVARHQHATGCVVVLAGRTHGAPALDVPHVAVATARDGTATAEWLVPYAAMAIAAGFRARGRDAVVVMDDVDTWRHALARVPAYGAWRSQLGRLASSAYVTATGSVSLIARVRRFEPLIGDCVDHVVGLAAAGAGTWYATTKTVHPPIRVRGKRELGYATIAMMERDHPTRGLDGKRIQACVRYRPGATVDSLEQVVALLAVLETEVPLAAIDRFVDAYLATLRRDHARRLAAIRAAGIVDEPERAHLRMVAAAVAVDVT